MRRLRIFAALLGCFAALATGLPVFAAVSAPAARSDLSLSAAPQPCDPCQDCGRNPCAGMIDCTAPCAVSMPILGVVSADLPSVETSGIGWPARLATIDGEQPPPDPLPPRL